MIRYWIGVASKEHVMSGVEGSFAQICHGKASPLNLMSPNDWIIYYSPTYFFDGKDPCRSFTAIGQILEGEPYLFKMSEDFIPYRRNVNFFPWIDVPILPLINKLSFITDKTKWGFPFRRGCFAIAKTDFQLITEQISRFTV